ncbi:NAD(P)/FAD-dependent oxidoreductase [Pseudonocardia sp. GCM10023141]|uniref:NAD(P)/FAD-dependent oxidoreductase n=1 Tax=Pseudonocardia sp. GCM10023141 TaxID=3252653 RepID=UPI0036193D27
MTTSVLVVGASIAGLRTAQALRSHGFEGRLVLVGDEPHLPYDRPPLSKQFLTGGRDAASLELVSERDAEDAGIELRLGCPAVRLDLPGQQVGLEDGTHLAYDNLVVATGAAARRPSWLPPSGTHVLRSRADGEALAADLRRPGPVVVVGAGFIGCEVAATARSLGHEVTIVDPRQAPIGRAVGPEVGHYLTEQHHRHGVVTRFGVGVDNVDGHAGDLRVDLSDGTHLGAATVVVGIGAVPNVAWLAGSGLEIDNGVLCDQHSRALGAQDVFAVGDVARWYHPRHQKHVRAEHWTNAVEQASCVAHNLLHRGDLRSYQPVEYVWSDQYDWKIQIVGMPSLATGVQLVGNWTGNDARAAALYADATGRLCGALTVNWPQAQVRSRRMIARSATFPESLQQITDLRPSAAIAASSSETQPR